MFSLRNWCHFHCPVPEAFGSAGQHACLTTQAASDRLRGLSPDLLSREAEASNGHAVLQGNTLVGVSQNQESPVTWVPQKVEYPPKKIEKNACDSGTSWPGYNPSVRAPAKKPEVPTTQRRDLQRTKFGTHQVVQGDSLKKGGNRFAKCRERIHTIHGVCPCNISQISTVMKHGWHMSRHICSKCAAICQHEHRGC